MKRSGFLKKQIMILLLFALTVAFLAVLNIKTSGSDDHFTLSGRWFEKVINGETAWVTVNQGAMIHFRTEGAESAKLRFTEISRLETPYYAYIVDGGEPVRKKITDGSILLPDRGKHEICVVIDGITEREDKWYGEIGVAFHGIECDGRVRGTAPKQKTILFIGDSITEGIMTLSDHAVSDYNSATHSFPWYTAKNLDAEPYFVGFGGSGIVAEGSFQTNSVALDYYSVSRPIPESDMPDCSLAVINTGTNDHGVESDVFTEGYRELLLKVHDRYPDAKVVCMIPFNQSHAGDIRSAAKDYSWCHIVETEGWEISYSDEGLHPDAAGSKVIGDNLAEYIREEIDP